MEFIAMRGLLSAILKNATAGTPIATPLSDAYVGLSLSPVSPSQDLDIAQLEEAAYPGYARLPLDPTKWTAPSFNRDGSCVTFNSSLVTFKMGDGTVPTQVQSIFLADDVTAGVLLAICALDAPISLITPDQGLHVNVEVRMGPNISLGSPDIIA